MKANQVATEVLGWLRKAASIMILVLLAVALAKAFGIRIPIQTVGHTELAYLAGAYWLTK